MNVGELTTIRLDSIDGTASTQVRVDLNTDAIEQLVAVINDGRTNEIPPIDVFYEGDRYVIGDGWHRYEAHHQADLTLIAVRLRKGSERDARMFACSANQKHGVRRTKADRRRAIETVLKDADGVDWSNRKIAEHCGVDDHLVADVRQELFEPSDSTAENPQLNSESKEPAKRVGRDGKSRKQPTPKEGPSARKRESAAKEESDAAPPAAERAKKSGREKVTAAERKKVHATFRSLARQLDDLKWMVDVEQEMAAIAEKLKDRWG